MRSVMLARRVSGIGSPLHFDRRRPESLNHHTIDARRRQCGAGARGRASTSLTARPVLFPLPLPAPHALVQLGQRARAAVAPDGAGQALNQGSRLHQRLRTSRRQSGSALAPSTSGRRPSPSRANGILMKAYTVALAVVAAVAFTTGCAAEEDEMREAAYPAPIGYTLPPQTGASE